MNLIITTPEFLEHLIKGTVTSVLKDFYIAQAAEKSKKKRYTIKEAAAEANVSMLTIRNYIARGHLKAQKIGRRILISSESLEEAMKEVKSLRYKR